MRNIYLAILPILLIVLGSLRLQAQSASLFDDRKVNAIYVYIHPDSLQFLYQNPLNDRYLRANMAYEDGQFRDSIANIGFRLRGNTSRFAQKKSFKISFNTFVSGRKYQGVKKLNLNGQHNDPTMIREKLYYDLWNKTNTINRRTTFARLFVNGNYMGLYTGLEEMDKDWLDRVYGENDGNLFKCTYPAPMHFLGSNPELYKAVQSSASTGGRAYALETNEAEDDYQRFAQLVQTLNLQDDATFLTQIHSIFNVDQMLKAFAMDVASGNWDGYAYNKNNFFLYQNPVSQQFDYIAYDTDNTFGVDWLGKNWSTRNCLTWAHTTESRPMIHRLLAVPSFRNRFYVLLDSLTRTSFAPDSVFPHIDSLKARILPYVAADPYRMLDYGYDMADFHLGFTGTVDQHTPQGIKPFLQLRYQHTLAQLQVILANQNREPGTMPGFIAFPNPGDGEIHISVFDPKDILEIEVWNSQGQLIDKLELEKKWDGFHFATSHWPEGMYYLRSVGSGKPFQMVWLKGKQ